LTVVSSSSGHKINGDRRLSKLNRILWLLLNRLNNSRATSDLDPSLEFAQLRIPSAQSVWPRIDAKASPARRLCDLFWLTLPWQQIANELRNSVKALEIGCGTGRYGLLMRECLGDAFRGYVGLDATRHIEWDQHRSDPQFEFICADSGSIEQYLAGANLIFTQSALEHFEEDLTFFRQIAKYIATANRPILQFHLIPSASCLTTFPWHGVRQYTPRTVSRITRLFGPETTKRLYSLGSVACNRIHRRYVTYPQFLGKGDQRLEQSAAYDHDLREAVKQDESEPGRNEACFYALALQSRLRRDIFSQPGSSFTGPVSSK
jgi:hypothetical protein